MRNFQYISNEIKTSELSYLRIRCIEYSLNILDEKLFQMEAAEGAS